MTILRDRNNPVRLFVRRLGMVALLAFIIFSASAVWSVYGKEKESRILRSHAEAELLHLTTEQGQLSANIEKLKTARGKEEALREHYEVGRKGEGLIVIVDPEQPEPIREEAGIREWVHKFLPFW